MTDWDARTYDRVADTQARWGERLLHRVPLLGNEVVMDAGCGTGRVTERVAQRLPYGLVVGVDRSPAMLERASARLARFGPRVRLLQADLAALPPLPAVDVILSTAVFHWVPDHDALFRSLAGVVRSGGRLAAECGGIGNIASVIASLERLGRPLLANVHFATPTETGDRLRAAGFGHARAWLRHEPVAFDSDADFRAFLRTVVLRSEIAGLPSAEQAELVAAVAAEVGEPRLDFVRLEIDAVRD